MSIPSLAISGKGLTRCMHVKSEEKPSEHVCQGSKSEVVLTAQYLVCQASSSTISRNKELLEDTILSQQERPSL